MEHRLVLSADAALDGIEADSIIDAIFNQVDVPRDLQVQTGN